MKGYENLKNEVNLIAQLQHRILVKVFSCCIEVEERMLIYDYTPNKVNIWIYFECFWRRNWELIYWKNVMYWRKIYWKHECIWFCFGKINWEDSILGKCMQTKIVFDNFCFVVHFKSLFFYYRVLRYILSFKLL